MLFAPKSSDYVGIDVSPEMINAIRRRFADNSTLRATFQRGDVRQLDFADAEFDLALFSFNGLDSTEGHDRRARSFRISQGASIGRLAGFFLQQSRIRSVVPFVDQIDAGDFRWYNGAKAYVSPSPCIAVRAHK